MPIKFSVKMIKIANITIIFQTGLFDIVAHLENYSIFSTVIQYIG